MVQKIFPHSPKDFSLSDPLTGDGALGCELTDPGTSDRALVLRMLAGEEAAFEEFFQTNFPRLYRFALIRLGYDEDAAEEVVQTTLCKAIGKLETYRGEAALFTWLCTFCRHEMSAHFKKLKREPSVIGLVEDSPEVCSVLESLAQTLDDPEESVHRSEISRLVQVTLDYLPPKYGDALEWKYIQGLNVKEIAARLNVGPKAAESLLTRAREAFRDGFESLMRGANKSEWMAR